MLVFSTVSSWSGRFYFFIAFSVLRATTRNDSRRFARRRRASCGHRAVFRAARRNPHTRCCAGRSSSGAEAVAHRARYRRGGRRRRFRTGRGRSVPQAVSAAGAPHAPQGRRGYISPSSATNFLLSRAPVPVYFRSGRRGRGCRRIRAGASFRSSGARPFSVEGPRVMDILRHSSGV